MRPLLVALLLGLLLVSVTAAASERRERIAILEVALEGDAPPELRLQVSKSIDGGLVAAGYEPIDRDDVAARLRGSRTLQGCVSTTCLARIGALVNAHRFLRARVEASGAAYTLEVSLLSPNTPGGLVQKVERSCPVCTLREVNDLASRLAVELVTGRPAANAPGRVAITSRPTGAAIAIDGVPAGVAPLEMDVDPGEHAFRGTLAPGFRPAEVSRAINPGERAEIFIGLEPGPPPVEPAPRSRHGAWRWVTAGGAVVLAAGGAALLAIDGQAVDCTPGVTCKSLRDTRTAGLAALGAGVALGGVATYLFLTDRVEAAVVPTPGGAHVSARLRF